MASPARLTTTLELPRLLPPEWGAYLSRAVASADRLFDFLAVFAGAYAADAIHLAFRRQPSGWGNPSARLLCAAAFAMTFVLLLDRRGGYQPWGSLLAIRDTERALRVTLQACSLALVVVYFCAVPVSRPTIALAVILVPVLLVLERREFCKLLSALRSQGFGTRRAVILGTGSTARRLYTTLLDSPKFSIEPVAFVEEGATGTTEIYECSYRRKHSAKVLPGPLEPELFRRLGASVLMVAEPGLDAETMQRTLMVEAEELGVEVHFVVDEVLGAGMRVDYTELDGILLAHPSKECNRALYDFGKRALDIMGALIGLLLLALIAPAIAILIKKTSAGPVFFRQQRAGKAGRPFTMYKFRTMYQGAPQYGYSPVEGEDPRITPVGRFLRRTSLDEVPQVLNVLLGDMSLVGPRPEMPFIVEQYTPSQRQRLAVRPGLTGLWQISGDRAFPINDSPEYDEYYVRHRSLFMDVAIMLHTVLLAARGV